MSSLVRPGPRRSGRAVELLSGTTSRRKVLRVEGATPEEVLAAFGLA